jgi:hypothetical protein
MWEANRSPHDSRSRSQSSALPPNRRAQSSGPADRSLPDARLVPLDLEGDQRRNQVIDIRRAREQHREGPVATVVPAPPAGGRLAVAPGLDRQSGGDQCLHLLPHRDQLGADDPIGEAADRVDKRAEIELVARRERVQARADRPVRGLEHAQVRLAARAQQGCVRPLVELHLVAQPRASVGEAGKGEAGDSQRLPS